MWSLRNGLVTPFPVSLAFANISGGRIYLGVSDKGKSVSNIHNTLHFLKQELRVKYEMTGTAQRHDVYEIPLDALREAVINGVMHRDYILFGSHMRVENI